MAVRFSDLLSGENLSDMQHMSGLVNVQGGVVACALFPPLGIAFKAFVLEIWRLVATVFQVMKLECCNMLHWGQSPQLRPSEKPQLGQL